MLVGASFLHRRPHRPEPECSMRYSPRGRCRSMRGLKSDGAKPRPRYQHLPESGGHGAPSEQTSRACTAPLRTARANGRPPTVRRNRRHRFARGSLKTPTTIMRTMPKATPSAMQAPNPSSSFSGPHRISLSISPWREVAIWLKHQAADIVPSPIWSSSASRFRSLPRRPPHCNVLVGESSACPLQNENCTFTCSRRFPAAVSNDVPNPGAPKSLTGTPN